MTTADFLAACFWPLVILFAVLLNTVRDPVLLRWIGSIIGSFIALCVILWVAYGPSSLVGVVDFYLFLFILGLGLIWLGLQEWYFFRSISKSILKACTAMLGGAALAVLMGTILIQDFFQSPIVLEGRVQNLRTRGRHNSEYVADIAGRTVKVTTPVYDRLKFLPVVRVEVGRGSNYVYAIEYLAN
jgi:hypothetical protein